MGSGFFTVGVTGLAAAQMGIQTAGHNIANATTEGYNRQVNIQTSNTPMFTGSGFIGQGTNVQTVRRVYSDFLSEQTMAAQTNVAELQAYNAQISQIDNLLADSSAGLSTSMQSFFAAVDGVSANPASVPARQALLAAAQGTVSRFHSIDQQLTAIRDGTNGQIGTEIGTINSLVQQVADLNQRIIIAQAAAASQPANDLLDQRDKLVADLNKEIKVSKQLETDGSYSLFFGSGQPLTVGAQIYQLTATPSPEDHSQLGVSLKAPNGQSIEIPETLISGGTLGGLLKFRSETLDTAQNALGRIAMSFSMQFNAQHKLGQDLSGTLGGNFFKEMTPEVLSAPTNLGTADISATVRMSDYKVSFSGGQYEIVRVADDTSLGSFTKLPQVVDGIRISQMAGTPADGDTFLVEPDMPPGLRVKPLSTNTGTATLDSTGSNLQSMSDSDYRLIATSTGSFTLVRISDEQTWTGRGATQAAALADLMTQAAPLGFDIAMTGSATVGDSFLIRPTRNAASAIDMVVSDPRTIAVALPMRTAADSANGGSGTISLGNVESVATRLSSNVKLTYEDNGTSQSLYGFPVGAKVLVGATAYDIASSTQRVPFTAGATFSFQGIGFKIPSTPINGDTFFVGPAGVSTSSATDLIVSASAVSGATGVNSALQYNAATGTLSGFPAGAVLTITDFAGNAVAGSPFTVTSTAQTFALPPAAAPGGVPGGIFSFSGTTVNIAGSSATDVAISPLGTLATTTSSVPAAKIDLTYKQADSTAGLPARITGFPAGTLVRVTLPSGSVAEYPMDDTQPNSEYVPYTAGATISFNGYSFVIDGAPVDGDRFSVSPNPSATADNRNALNLSSMQTAKTMLDGSANYSSAYSQIVASIGNKARQISVTQTAQENLVTQNENAVQSLSGVNLDEEAANLMRYQQAYQAAAKMIDISGKLFDQLLNQL